MEILWENTMSPEFRVNHPKPWWNYAFPPSFHARKLGEITIFYVVDPAPSLSLFRKLKASFIKEFFYYKQSFASLLQGFPKLVIATLNNNWWPTFCLNWKRKYHGDMTEASVLCFSSMARFCFLRDLFFHKKWFSTTSSMKIKIFQYGYRHICRFKHYTDFGCATKCACCT